MDSKYPYLSVKSSVMLLKYIWLFQSIYHIESWDIAHMDVNGEERSNVFPLFI